MIFGTTFSHLYVRDHFKLSVKEAYSELLNLKLDLVRLGCYWSEIEKQPGQYDFSQINKLLAMSEKASQAIVLTIGMKAPRWPEFYLPSWTNYSSTISQPHQFLAFIEQMIKQIIKFKCVKYLQIENEPLDISGPNKLTVPLSILKQEVILGRRLSSLPLVLTLWGNKSLQDNRLKQLTGLADIIGLDLYYQIPDGKGGYWGPANYLQQLKKIVQRLNKPVWITELQTNPWKKSPRLTNKQIFEINFNQARLLPVEAILFWGYEYWYSQKSQGKDGSWKTILARIDLNKAA